MKWFLQLLSGEPHFYIGGKENPYMLRWFILPMCARELFYVRNDCGAHHQAFDIIGEWPEPGTVKTVIVAYLLSDGRPTRAIYDNRGAAERWASTLRERGLRYVISEIDMVIP